MQQQNTEYEMAPHFIAQQQAIIGHSHSQQQYPADSFYNAQMFPLMQPSNGSFFSK